MNTDNTTLLIIVSTLIIVIFCIALIYLFIYSLNKKKQLLECINNNKKDVV